MKIKFPIAILIILLFISSNSFAQKRHGGGRSKGTHYAKAQAKEKQSTHTKKIKSANKTTKQPADKSKNLKKQP